MRFFFAKLFVIGLIVAACTAPAAADRETRMTNPNTGDTIVVHTDDKGTQVRHGNGKTGTTSGSDTHDDTVRDYEKGGYQKD